MSQKDAFFEGEADAWFERNRREIDCASDPVISAVERLGMRPKSVLEIGCGSGTRLECFRQKLGSVCHGIEPSNKAVQFGQAKHPALHLKQGSADHLPFEANSFDMVIFGFCLYLCDAADYFQIAQQADRVLREKGNLVILDFASPVPYRTPYSHRQGLYSHKMDWAPMFTWHPFYRLISRGYAEHNEANTFHPHERITIDIFRKDLDFAFITNPYAAETD